MKQFRFYILIATVLLFSSCSSLKEGFVNQKKNNSDEFLVEKKSPLVMPPDYNELPEPNLSEENEKLKESEIKTLITDEENLSKDNENPLNESLEKELLKKIKKN